MSEFENYMLQQAKKEAASYQYNYAAKVLEVAGIKERLAEIKSQHEPLESLSKMPLSLRDMLYATAFYVVVGRLPDNAPDEDGKVKVK